MSNLVADAVKQLSYLQVLYLLVSLRFCYLVCYGLYFHPLKSFPGPRLAAVTDLYQGYYASWKNGMFAKHLEELHRVYGPVIRVRPNELHFSTPEAYFAIYPPHSGFPKDPGFYRRFGNDDAAFGMTDVQAHRKRRDILNPLFSRRAILKLENVVQDKVDVFMEQIRHHNGEALDFFHGFQSLTMDIVTAYCYAHSFGALTMPGFDHPIMRAVKGAAVLATAAQYLPVLRMMHHLPMWLSTMLNPDVAGVAQMRSFLTARVDEILKNPDALASAEHETIYHHLITPELIKRGDVPSKKALIEEAMVLVVAGTDTTSNAMTVGLFHLLSDESTRQKLEAELQAAWPEKDTPFSYEMAEKLPYLTGVIKEALRLSIGVPIALPRIVTSPTVIDGAAIPAGTVVAVSPQFVLGAPDIFPDPLAFKPERWMAPDSQKLDKYLIVFSKGPRSCLGINLAWCELYLAFAHLVRKFDMQLHKTSKKDMVFRDHIVPIWKDVKHLHAVVHERVI
ncbi:cytochrome P450 [Hymenopellis radicata]|nr:cytochrome P450 [Hymenopellis radicata]